MPTYFVNKYFLVELEKGKRDRETINYASFLNKSSLDFKILDNIIRSTGLV